ncbi:aldo/keto reductase [Cellulosilyticum sp. I15G10I2]|uniref:aldo/keto reductase n=1 Tax=Cellulosilyticum sp. I15G10I2 TaxID=1892843 RepID=UPI001FA7CDA2|nr:aldo/keto reductase [Cellulosilyticum sp. I15G10I2]
MKKFILNNGIEMPVIGLGTYPMNGNLLIETMLKSITYGYRSFDTSSAYQNHESIGEAIRLCDKNRDKIFITTKLSNSQQRSGNVEGALKRSLSILGLKYVDLYLIHWPETDHYLESWIQMENLYKQGLVRAIGVCNFHEHHLKSLLNIANVIPAVNQIELHPCLTQKPLTRFCESYQIRVEAYSPLARMHRKLVENPILLQVADKYKKSVPQIILRWNYQNGIISIPKTQDSKRLRDNISIFDFSLLPEEMAAIEAINEDFRVRHDPDNCDFSKL